MERRMRLDAAPSLITVHDPHFAAPKQLGWMPFFRIFAAVSNSALRSEHHYYRLPGAKQLHCTAENRQIDSSYLVFHTGELPRLPKPVAISRLAGASFSRMARDWRWYSSALS